VSEQKDYPTLIRAAATLISRFPQLYFLIVGDNQLSPEHRAHYAKIAALITDAQLTGHFIFAGFRTDVPRLLAATDISLLSTHWEGLPLVILEAMAQSKPVIATDVDGVHEAVVAGSTGLLYPHEDAVALASCITQLVDDPARRIAMGMEGRKRIEQGFSQASFSEGMLSVYDATL
jgi:glycosyltransferase involved in cell wall biosynthesis